MKLTLVILHTNDFHSTLDAFAKVATLAERARAEHPGRVLLLDSGDTFYFHREPDARMPLTDGVLDLMAAMGYDAFTPGNRDLAPARAEEVLAELAPRLPFPIVAANVVNRATGQLWPGMRPYVTKELDGIRVGILGLVAAGGHPGASDPLVAAQRYAPVLRPQCDLLLLLAHLSSKQVLPVVSQVPGIDLVLGGHSHEICRQPLSLAGVPYFQAGNFGKLITRIVLTLNGKRLAGMTSEIVSLDASIQEHPGIAYRAAALRRRLEGR